MLHRTHTGLFLLAAGTASLVACFGGRPEYSRNGQDLIAAGASAIYDSVPGDVILTGRDITFATPAAAGGDYLAAAGDQDIFGRVHGSVRAVGGEIHLRGSVDRNATIAGGRVSVDSGGVIAGNAYLAGGEVSVAGQIGGALAVSAGEVELDGVIGRDVEVTGGSLRIGPRAQITGNLRYRVEKKKVTIDSAARISGTVTALPVRKNTVGDLAWPLGILLAGVIAVALFPGYTSGAAEILPRRPIVSGLLGIGWVVFAPVAVIIAVITIIGIPLAIITAACYVGVLLLSDIPFAIWLGHLLLGARSRTGRQGVLIKFLIGGLILFVVHFIPVAGTILGAVAAVFGLGALVLAAWSRHRSSDIAPAY
jgi:cytoskeletal protein CcmA (bactofilin family)